MNLLKQHGMSVGGDGAAGVASAAGSGLSPRQGHLLETPLLNQGTALMSDEWNAFGLSGRLQAKSIRGEYEGNLRQQEERGGLLDMVGNCAPMLRVFERIQLVAPTCSTVLITGESGSGKELVVRAIHQLSPRKEGSFVALELRRHPERPG